MYRSFLLTVIALVAMAVNAQAQTPRDVDDLVNDRASSGERELRNRGYDHIKTMDLEHSSIGYWWSSHRDQCIAVTTKDGRFTSIMEQPDSVCSDRGGYHGNDDWGDNRSGSSDWGSGGSHEHGVTLYRDLNFTGVSETYSDDVPDMRRTRFGDDHATSVSIGRGCTARLYQDLDYQGAYTEVTDDIGDLRGSRVGDDQVTSLQVRCDGRHSSGDSWGSRGHDHHDSGDYRGGSSSSSNLHNLQGMRASSGEQELKDRGYFYRSTKKVGGNSIAYWWSPKEQRCIAVTTADGHYSSIVNQPERMCDDSTVR